MLSAVRFDTVREPVVGTCPTLLRRAWVALNDDHCKRDEPLYATVVGCADIQHDGCAYTGRGGGKGGVLGRGATTEIWPGIICWATFPMPGNDCTYQGSCA